MENIGILEEYKSSYTNCISLWIKLGDDLNKISQMIKDEIYNAERLGQHMLVASLYVCKKSLDDNIFETGQKYFTHGYIIYSLPNIENKSLYLADNKFHTTNVAKNKI